jgi:cytochrome c oxidase subunit 2
MNRVTSCLTITLLAVPALAQPLSSGVPSVQIKMTAKKYEFDPGVINVKKGDDVELVITALDHDHGFKLEVFKINERLKKGTATTVRFTPDKAGTFPFECSHFCGVGHGRMKGKLVVSE